MTTPIAHGYPDWTRQTPASDVLFIKESIGAPLAGVTRGPFFVGATPAVGVYVNANGTGHQVALNFYADQAGTQFLGTQSIDLSAAGVFFRGAIRVLGPWVKIAIAPFAAGNSIDLLAWAAPTPGTIFGTFDENVLVQANQAIGIGATVTLTAGRVHPGVAHLYAAQRAGIYTASVFTVNFAGGRTFVLRRNMAAGEFFDEMIALGSGTPQVEIINTSGAAQTIDVHLTAVQNLTG